MIKKRKIIILLIATVVLMSVIGANLGKFLVQSDKLEKADAIAVFSGDSGARTERAVELLKEGYADYLILSGGKVYDDVTMAELMKNHAIKLGVDEDKILIDDEASTTNENAAFTAEIIEEHNFKSAIVVTSDYHTRRSKLAMEKALENTLIDGEKVSVSVTPSKEEKFTTKWWTSGNSVLMVISEYLKLAGYWVKGYI